MFPEGKDNTADEDMTSPEDELVEAPERRDDVLQEEHIGIIIGALAALILILFAVSVFIVIRNRRRKLEQANSFGPYEKQHMTTGDVDDFKFANGMLGSYHMYNSIGSSEGDYDDDSFKKPRAEDSPVEKDNQVQGPRTPEGRKFWWLSHLILMAQISITLSMIRNKQLYHVVEYSVQSLILNIPCCIFAFKISVA